MHFQALGPCGMSWGPHLHATQTLHHQLALLGLLRCRPRSSVRWDGGRRGDAGAPHCFPGPAQLPASSWAWTVLTLVGEAEILSHNGPKLHYQLLTQITKGKKLLLIAFAPLAFLEKKLVINYTFPPLTHPGHWGPNSRRP